MRLRYSYKVNFFQSLRKLHCDRKTIFTYKISFYNIRGVYFLKFLRLLFLLFVFIIVGCLQQGEPNEGKPLENQPEIRDVGENLQKDLYREVTIEIGAIGDVLLHERVYEHAALGDGNYDFLPMLIETKPLLQAPDFLMANLESIPGGVEIGLSTYPSFNSPKEIITNLQSLGVDMVVGANNHTLDRGLRAVESAINYYDKIGMPYVGKYLNDEDRENDRIVTVNDVKVGVLAYTYGTNGIPIPKGHEYVVALINPEEIIKDVQKIQDKVDVTVVHMHWGAEYSREPNKNQRELAKTLADAGVDIIIGHHPHVLQPIEWIQGKNGNKTVVFYSLGNFFSGQNFAYTDIGGVATVKVKKIFGGSKTDISIHSPEITPTQVVRKDNGYFVYPMAEAIKPSVSGVTIEEIREHTTLYINE